MRSYGKVVVIRPDFTVLEPEALERYLSNELYGPPNRASQELVYADVRARREDWNVYALNDGTRLKLRAVVTRVNRPRTPGAQGVPDISNIMLVCNPPRDKKGPPMPNPPKPGELTSSIVERNVGFRTVNEPVNEYVTDDGKRIVLRLRLYSLARTSKFDAKGDPIYLFDARPEITTVD